jgi:hypothetical protein
MEKKQLVSLGYYTVLSFEVEAETDEQAIETVKELHRVNSLRDLEDVANRVHLDHEEVLIQSEGEV